MSAAIVGLVGIVVGALLGGTGKYFTQRRDAWLKARASGLALLAEVRAVRAALAAGRLTTVVAIEGWTTHGEVLASFRRGNYPSGLVASEWLKLAAGFAELATLDAKAVRDEAWTERVDHELRAAQEILKGFEHDPAVLPSVIEAGVSRYLKQLALLAVGLLVLGRFAMADAGDEHGWVRISLDVGLLSSVVTVGLVVAALVWRPRPDAESSEVMAP
ncbi:MAG: hypothetical protein QOJ89_983 [bacterium]